MATDLMATDLPFELQVAARIAAVEATLTHILKSGDYPDNLMQNAVWEFRALSDTWVRRTFPQSQVEFRSYGEGRIRRMFGEDATRDTKP